MASSNTERPPQSRLLEPVLLGVAAAAVLLVAVVANLIPRPSGISLVDWQVRIPTLRVVLTVYGAALLLGAAFSSYLSVRSSPTLVCRARQLGSNLWAEVRASVAWTDRESRLRSEANWLCCAVGIAASLRAFFLARPMHYDESYTFLSFVNTGIPNLFYYPLPNNHILHTLMVWLSVHLFGKNVVGIRLPAFLAGLAVVVLTFALARLVGKSRTSGFGAAVIVGVFPTLVNFDTQARGYSLLSMFFLALAIVSVRLARRPSALISLIAASIVALGLFTMPSFLLPASGIAIWLLICWRMARTPPRRVVVAGATAAIGAAVVTAVLYTPTILISNGVSSLVSNRFVAALDGPTFLARLPQHVAGSAEAYAADGTTVGMAIFLTAVLAGFAACFRERQWEVLALGPAMLVGSFLVLVGKQAIPYPRTWMYLVPLAAIYADLGLTDWIRIEARKFKLSALLIFALAAIAIAIVTPGSLADADDFPEARDVAAYLAAHMKAGDTLAMRVPVGAPMRFYLWELGVPYNVKAEATEPRMFVVVKKSSYTAEEITDRKVERVFELRDAEVYATVD